MERRLNSERATLYTLGTINAIGYQRAVGKNKKREQIRRYEFLEKDEDGSTYRHVLSIRANGTYL